MTSSLLKEDVYRLSKLFSSKKSAARTKGVRFEFKDVNDFVSWWQSEFDIQNRACAYCRTRIDLIACLIEKHDLPARKLRGGAYRGPVLELDRKDPKGPYSKENCALVCYYCNNDKSYTYDAATYEEFFGPSRKRHFDVLAAKYDIDPDTL